MIRSAIMSMAVSSSSSSHSVPPGRRYFTFVSRPGCWMSWREAEPFGHSVPWLIGERGLPSMSTSSLLPRAEPSSPLRSRVYTSCPQPTAQYGQTDSVTLRPPMRALASFVCLETATGPMPQSSARPTTGARRSRSNARGRPEGSGSRPRGGMASSLGIGCGVLPFPAVPCAPAVLVLTQEGRVGDQEDARDDEGEEGEQAEHARDQGVEGHHEHQP